MSPDSNQDKMMHTLDSMPTYSFLESLYAKNHESPVFHKKETSKVYADLFAKVEEIVLVGFKGSPTRSVRDLPFSSLFSLAEMLVYVIPGNPDVLVQAMRPDYLANFFPCHLLNVAILSFEVGRMMKMQACDLTELVVAALVHDIGMTLIDPAVFWHDRRISEHEKSVIWSHPIEGYKYMENVAGEFPWLTQVILEEHKRENGTGYPREVSEDLHPYSKIVGLCDVFEALSHRRHHRPAFHPADAMKMIIREKGQKFSQQVVKGLIEAVSLYPIGSFVYLNNEKVARVVKSVRINPLRPIVQVIDEKSNRRQTIDLSRQSNIYVAAIAYDENYQPGKTR